MTIPKIEPQFLGRSYLVGGLMGGWGLLSNNWVFSLLGMLLLIWAMLSDTDESNHIDPPGTQYMDRDGRLTGGDDAPVS